MCGFASGALILVIGASRGFGRQIVAKAFRNLSVQAGNTCTLENAHGTAPQLDPLTPKPHTHVPLEHIHFVLIGRDINGMKETGEIAKASGPNVSYEVNKLDLLEVGNDAFESKIDGILMHCGMEQYKHIYLVHNSGDVSPPSFLNNASSAAIRKSVDLNLTAFCVINARFQNFIVSFLKTRLATSVPTSVRVINISSLAALIPFASIPIYSITKAARDMGMKVMDLEMREQVVGLKTISWAPGQMATDMLEVVKTAESTLTFTNACTPSINVDPEFSASLLWRVVSLDEYVSGMHVDVYDVDDQGRFISK